MDQIFKFLNSPLVIVAATGIIVVWYAIRKLTYKNKCRYCKKGEMVEVETTPVDTIYNDYSHWHSSADHHSGIQTVVKVKYACNNCDEFYEIDENR